MDRTFIVTCVACAAAFLVSSMGFAAPAPAEPAAAPRTLRLWEGQAPGALGDEESTKATNDVPTITIYPAPASSNNGAAIVICPGGGYGGLAEHEGKPVAQWANGLGVTGIVLKYRLGPKYHHPVEMHDVQRAIRMTRAHAGEWGIDPNRVGVLGFSAGGHLASTAATHFDAGDVNASDPIDRVSSRPDIAVLVYPVITMTTPYTHGGSRHNLLGDHPDEKLIDLLSNEKQVTDQTPPVYLVHATDDGVVPVQNSLNFALALSQHKNHWAGRFFDHGGHGFGLGVNDPQLSTWPASCAQWLGDQGFLKAHPKK